MIRDTIMAFYCAGFGYVLANWECVMEERKQLWPPKTRRDWGTMFLGFWMSVSWPVTVPLLAVMHYWGKKRGNPTKAPVDGFSPTPPARNNTDKGSSQ